MPVNSHPTPNYHRAPLRTPEFAALAAYVELPSLLVPGFGLGALDLHQPYYRPADTPPPHREARPPPPPPAPTMSPSVSSDQFEVSPAKRQKVVGPARETTPMARGGDICGEHSRHRSSSIQSLATTPSEITAASPKEKSATPTTAPKSRRVRTGCLTCRERHLKCDEAVPDCLNCRKSNRECKRGVRLNFIDVQVHDTLLLAPTPDWIVQFQDESRLIASEYRGGLTRYEVLDRSTPTPPQEVDAAGSLRGRHERSDSSVTALSTGDGASSSGPSGVAPSSMYSFSLKHRHQHRHEGIRAFDASHMHSRGSSDASFLATPRSGHSHPQNYGLGIQDQPGSASKAETTPRTHAYRTSDASSVASFSTPAVVGPSQTFSASSGDLAATGGIVTPPPSAKTLSSERAYLNSPDEIFYMQVFVEEVGIWMDSLDKDKHFSRLIPYDSLRSPMLLNAFLACGVKHLTLVNPAYNDDKALFYYDTATTQLLRSLQNPDRNTAECATTAVVLNVYEIMSEKPAKRMNHIAGARALIRECGWNAKSTGVGAACFWLNIGMEVLSCLAFNWKTAWDPDQWGVDMDFSPPETDARDDADGGVGSDKGVGSEEIWVHRILYIVGRIANFRATMPQFQEPCPHAEQIRLGNRLSQWQELKRLCDDWHHACPKTMHPFGYLYPSQTKTKSAFPNVWLIKRAAIIGRLFYHTAQCLLAQTHPMESTRSSDEMRAIQLHHAHQVCGIVAHNKDRGVSSVAIRSLAIASSVLVDPAEQDEVLEIMEKITSESGWRLGRVITSLKKAWGRESVEKGGLAAMLGQVPSSAQQQQQQQQSQQKSTQVATVRRAPSQSHTPVPFQPLTPQQTAPTKVSTPSPAPMVPVPPVVAPAPVNAAVINPLSLGDFSLPNHPYQNWYEPPSRATSFSQPFF
ncbi:related to regulatory protein for the arginine catabolic pathway [Cephalotrichum gorgonifer]|uniref:Related to regulatory protein for the arginine catabolic pathway n=1 Tax=Cephalotrichum gorgonifer TaxID=2041049 RepID=A0AAE8MY28_9PEZI|nr:related to regulatory protein for the arginine catabolic pathway [Cephalotrichum gorgonifer]